MLRCRYRDSVEAARRVVPPRGAGSGSVRRVTEPVPWLIQPAIPAPPMPRDEPGGIPFERGFALCRGSRQSPRLELFLDGFGRMPNSGRTYNDWTKELPGRIFDRATKRWSITGLGDVDPVPYLASLGIGVRPGDGDYGPEDLPDLIQPVAVRDGRCVRIDHRLLGYDIVAERLGLGATWDKSSRTFVMPVSEIVDGQGKVREGIDWPEDAVADAIEIRRRVLVKPEYAEFARACAAAIALEDEDERKLADWFGLLPDWFGLDLYGYQRHGSLAVALGHTLLADEPGVGKCESFSTMVEVNGIDRQIGELWDERAGRAEPEPDGVGEAIPLREGELAVPTLDVWTASTASASHLYRQPYRGEMRRIRTMTGREIECTPAHRLRGPSGWVRADEIRAGDLIALAAERPTPGSGLDDLALARVLAWHIGEGYDTQTGAILISNTDFGRIEQLQVDYADVVPRLTGGPAPFMSVEEAPRRKGHHRDARRLYVSSPAWRKWLDANGMLRTDRSADRFVPGIIMGASESTQAEFVRHYLAAEASVMPNCVEFSSASPRLVAQVSDLLARRGVVASSSVRMKAATNGSGIERPYAVATVSGADMRRLAELFGIADEAKQAKLDAACVRESTSNVLDRIPCQDAARWLVAQGLPARRTGIPATHLGGDRRGVTRKVARTVARALRRVADGTLLAEVRQEARTRWTAKTIAALEAIDTAEAARLAGWVEGMLDPSIRWVEVAEAETYDLDGYVYDLTVPSTSNYVAEGMWTHNTRTALAAAAIRKARRTVIIAPPLVLINWQRNVIESRLHDHGGELPGGEAIALVGSSKKVQHPPEQGVFIVADSKLASRPELIEELRAWEPDAVIYDEAHRGMTMGSKRSESVLDVMDAAKFRVPVTGTPMFASPHQLVPLLEMSGHLGPVFGGRDEFLKTYCTQDRFGSFRVKRKMPPDLHRRLAAHVWVRRLKRDVLPDLPFKSRSELPVQVPLTAYKEAHREVDEKIDEWIDTHLLPAVLTLPPGRQRAAAEQIAADYCQTNLGHVSRLREAAGACKVPSAVEAMAEHDIALDGQGLASRPLIVWAHHRTTIAALVEAARKKLGDSARVESIDGGTSPTERQRIVDDFQAGKVGILIAGITAAGVGITLTRSEDMLFVESDWTPGIIVQAEDRSNRIGSRQNLQIRTLVAEGTLDAAIQAVLYSKGLVLGAVTGGDVQVASEQHEGISVGDILAEIVQARLRAHPQLGRLWRAAP